MSDKPTCLTCKKGPPEVALKRCAKCSFAEYCSRECQRANWKIHKLMCGKFDTAPHASTRLSPPKGLDQPIAKPFTRLDNGTYLHDRPEADVYRILIDAYRLRVEDNYTMDGEVDEDSLYGGAPNGLRGFRRFLRLMETRTKLLPSWWNCEKKTECENFGLKKKAECEKFGVENWSGLMYAVEKSDIIEHYGDPLFPMQLRMLAQEVYRRGPGGSDGTAVRKMMVAMEEDDKELYKAVTTIDMTTMSLSFLKGGK